MPGFNRFGQPEHTCTDCQMRFATQQEKQQHWLAHHSPQAVEGYGDIYEVTGPDWEGRSWRIGRLGLLVDRRSVGGGDGRRIELRFVALADEHSGRAWYIEDSIRLWVPPRTFDPATLDAWLSDETS